MLTKIKSPQDLLALREKAQQSLDLRGGVKEIQITVHMGTCGIASGAREILGALAEEIEAHGVKNATVRQAGCAGLCDREPMLTLKDKSGNEYRYGKLDRERIHAIVSGHVVNGNPVMDYLIDK